MLGILQLSSGPSQPCDRHRGGTVHTLNDRGVRFSVLRGHPGVGERRGATAAGAGGRGEGKGKNNGCVCVWGMRGGG